MSAGIEHSRPDIVSFISLFCEARGYPVKILGPDLLEVVWDGQVLRYTADAQQADDETILVAPGTPAFEGMINECLLHGVGVRAALRMGEIIATAPDTVRGEMRLPEDVAVKVLGETERTLRRFTYRIHVGNTFAQEEVLWSIVLSDDGEMMPDFAPEDLPVRAERTGATAREVEKAHVVARREVDQVLTEMVEQFRQAMTEPLRERLGHLNDLYSQKEIESGEIQEEERRAAIDREMEAHAIRASARLVGFCELRAPLLVCRIGSDGEGVCQDVVLDAVYRHVQLARCGNCRREVNHGEMHGGVYWCAECVARTEKLWAQCETDPGSVTDAECAAEGCAAEECAEEVRPELRDAEGTDRAAEHADQSAVEPGGDAAGAAVAQMDPCTAAAGEASEVPGTVPVEPDAPPAQEATAGAGSQGEEAVALWQPHVVGDVREDRVDQPEPAASSDPEAEGSAPLPGADGETANTPAGADAQSGCAAHAGDSGEVSQARNPHLHIVRGESDLRDAGRGEAAAARQRRKIPRFMSAAPPGPRMPVSVRRMQRLAEQAPCLACSVHAGDPLEAPPAQGACRSCGAAFCRSCLSDGLCPACRSLCGARPEAIPYEVFRALPDLEGCHHFQIGIANGWFVVVGRRFLTVTVGVFDRYGNLLQCRTPEPGRSITFGVG